MKENEYRKQYDYSIQNPEAFWEEQASKYITWYKPWEAVLLGSFKNHDIRWFQGAKLNASYNCLDRHLATRGDQPAIIWESDDPAISKTISYHELHEKVCRFASVLKNLGIKKGDAVCIYLPMIPEAIVAMLACARIGAVHSVVFGGFSSEALKTRLLDADCKLVITANEGLRGKKVIPLKKNVDKALENCPLVSKVIVVKRTENEAQWVINRDEWFHELMDNTQTKCEPEIMGANDSLFILYTSGSTCTPKGILHTTAGYLVYAACTFQTIFDYQAGEVYWCTADVGWITGHTYGVYGPLLHGATMVMFEGVPTYPTPSRFWEVIDKHKVNIFYTAPTAIRALRSEGDQWVEKTSRKSLRLLGSVGEPINPEAWHWYYTIVGDERCDIVDTWWQTETGGIMISPIPEATPLKAGSAAWPFFGILPAIVDDQGHPVEPGKIGKLVITKPWPGMMQTIYKNRDRFIKSYFQEYPGSYVTGDQAKQDSQGYFWIAGRSDDVMKVSGHRIGTEEVESALVSHPSVAEAAVVGAEDKIKGQHIDAFVTLKVGEQPSDTLKNALNQTVRDVIGAVAVPQNIWWAEGLPKTRSGKIMRRLLRKIADNDTRELGDLSTLANPEVVEKLIKIRESENDETV